MAEDPIRLPDPETSTPHWPIEIRPNGTVIYDGIAIGGLSLEADAPHLTLNLGWLRLAGVGITLQGDPDVDRVRGGVVLSR